jgi:hypothetical protein
MREIANSHHRLAEHISRVLNKIRKPNSAEEITELLNRDLEPEDRPFRTREVAEWLLSVVLVFYLIGLGLNASQTGLLLTLTLVGDTVICLYLMTRADAGLGDDGC